MWNKDKRILLGFLCSYEVEFPTRGRLKGEFMGTTLIEWIEYIYPVIAEKKAKRSDAEVEEGTVKMYWAGTIIRIDIKPDQK